MKKKGSRLHTKEFNEEAVKLIKEQGEPISDTAEKLGGQSGLGSMANMQAKLKRLRKKNKRLELEREIFKKRPPSLPERLS